MILGRKVCQPCLLIHQDFQHGTRRNFSGRYPRLKKNKYSKKEERMLSSPFFSGTAQDLKGSVQVNIQGRVFISDAAPFFVQVLSG